MPWSPNRLAMLPTATGGIARLAAARLVASGRDPGPLLREAGLSHETIEDPRARIAVAAQIALLNLAADALDHELLGFHPARDFELREIGLLSFVLASSATLGEALARAERHSTLGNEGIVLRGLTGNEFRIRYSYAGVPRHADRHRIEF